MHEREGVYFLFLKKIFDNAQSSFFWKINPLFTRLTFFSIWMEEALVLPLDPPVLSSDFSLLVQMTVYSFIIFITFLNIILGIHFYEMWDWGLISEWLTFGGYFVKLRKEESYESSYLEQNIHIWQEIPVIYCTWSRYVGKGSPEILGKSKSNNLQYLGDYRINIFTSCADVFEARCTKRIYLLNQA